MKDWNGPCSRKRWLESGSPFFDQNMTPVDYSDVQGLAAYGYRDLIEARFLLVRVRSADAAAEWLRSAPVSSAEYRKPAPATALHVGFTPAGLSAMGLPEPLIAGFSSEFVQGMTESSRARRLGDTGRNDSSRWYWGAGPSMPNGIVMMYAKQNLDAWEQIVCRQGWDAAFETVNVLSTSDMAGREPFGFIDGISQPSYDWKRDQPFMATTSSYTNSVAIGELLLGYPNEYGKYTDRPLLDSSLDPAGFLSSAEDDPARKDLGRNGTYLVVRQLEQDVQGFWRYLDDAAQRNTGDRYVLAAALVGRRQSDGAPLIASDTSDSLNGFTYDVDPSGQRCPLGAHIRRANPRNADFFGHPSGVIAQTASRLGIPRPCMQADLIASTRFHRLLRRGREYGDGISPEEALAPTPASDSPRGLHFACLCANISRQFEFVQHAWMMSTKFNGLTEESDPILGSREAVGDSPVTGNFSIPIAGKLPRHLTGMPQFVTVRGGAYFFLPSLRALRYIAGSSKQVLPSRSNS